MPLSTSLPLDDRAKQAARLRTFIIWDLPINLINPPILVALHLYFDFPPLLIIAVEVLLNSALLIWAYREAGRGHVDRAVIALVCGILIITITVAYFVPVMVSIILLLNVFTVMVALPFLDARSMRLLMIIATGLTLVTAIMITRPDEFGAAQIFPAWVIIGLNIVFAPALIGVSYLLIWQYSTRLNDTLAEMRAANRALQESERSLEAKVVERTEALTQSNSQLTQEVDERARAEAALRSQNTYLEAIVQNSPAAIVVLETSGRVAAWNPAAEKLFGYSAAEAIGKPVDDLVANQPELHAEALRYTQTTTEQGTLRVIAQRTRKNGSRVDVEITAVALNVAGQIMGYMVIYHDITELQHARQEAEAATAAKSTFLATMSHEIRTPLNAIIGMSGLLLDTPLNSQQHEFVDIIRNSGDALLALINDILDFSKIEAGKMDVENTPFDLRDCVESALELVGLRAADKGLDLASTIAEGTPLAILGDVTRLRQICINLLNNAVKFTEKGEVVLSVSAEPRPATADATVLLHFTVHDTGIGIAPDDIQRLFKSFSQADASTTRKYGGTGLGLAISKRLAELMGGKMWVESPGLGQGATFHFTLPAMPAPSLPIHEQLSGEQPELVGKRLLIVDDNDTNRQILILQTAKWGLRPRDTASPAQALAWVQQGVPFDLAILDMHMPEMDGLNLAAEIRNYRDAQSLPLILFTSLGRSDAEASRVNFAAYLAKPLKASQLYDTLVSVIGGQPQRTGREGSLPGLDEHMAERLPLRILLAEDNLTNQKLALHILKRLGYRADVAANGLEAIEALQRQTYDIIFMDVQMPEMDGLEATRQICTYWPRGKRPRIIAMTANAMEGDREMCLAAGMDDYLSKPIRFETLSETLYRNSTRLDAGLRTASPSHNVETSAADSPTLNPQTLENLIKWVGDTEYLKELIQTFAEEAPQLLADMRLAQGRGDAELLGRAAHTLKSNSANFGATALAQLCRELEALGNSGDLAGSEGRIAQAEAEYERVKVALDQLSESL